ncbi:hypothetical protein [Streptococcus salivarius]|uniref:hypothetical protein n=1 Tax=Streptococcus salivarius TaxID=1304 RepID=UPI0034A3FCBF
MNRNYFEENVSNLGLFILFSLIEVGMIIWTWSFKSSETVRNITTDESLNTVTKAFKIVQIPDYYYHLISGLVWIFILLGLVLYTLKQNKFLGTLIYIIFIVIFWLIFWDPILTSFLILGSLGAAGIYSFDN